jgi:hypothetical protein
VGKQLVNEICSDLGGFLDQQDHAQTLGKIPGILASNLNDTILDRGLELYGIDISPLIQSAVQDSLRAHQSWCG